MVHDDAVLWVQQLMEALTAHDVPRILEFYSESALVISPVLGTHSGRDAMLRSWTKFFSLFPDFSVSAREVLLDGDRIAFIAHTVTTDRSGFFGVPYAGQQVEFRYVVLLNLAEGKIVRDERIFDLTGFIKQLEGARLGAELKLAREVQRALLSRTEYASEFCEAAGDSTPCRAIGGDFFELLQLPCGDFGIALCDVSGKGPASALLAAMIQGMLNVEIANGNSPAAVMDHLNRFLIGRTLEEQFATLVYGVLSPDGQFTCSTAGHDSPMIVTRNGIRRVSAGGPVLGLLPESRFEEESFSLEEEDIVVLFSDGITEACSPEGEEFGCERLMSYVLAGHTSSARQMLQRIFDAVQIFSGATSQSDDVTLAVAKFRSGKPHLGVGSTLPSS